MHSDTSVQKRPSDALASASDRSDPLRPLLLSAILAVTIITCFISGTSGSFMFDDLEAIVRNESIQHASLLQILKTKRDTPSAGRPLTNLSYAIDYALYGLNPRPYIWTNIILQVIIAILLMAVLRLILLLCVRPHVLSPKLADWLAMTMSLLWAIHPAQTECVLYITQRSEQFAMLSIVLAFYGMIRHHLSGNTQRRWLVLMFASCTLGMLFKQNTATLLLVLLLFDRAFLAGSYRELWRQRGRWYTATGVVVAAILTAIMLWDPTPLSTGTALGVTSWQYLMTQSQVILHYLANCFWPSGLCLYYDWPIAHHFADVAPAFVTLALLFVASCLCLIKWPKLGCCLLSVFLILGPTSSLIPIVTEVATDRRMSLMSVFVLFPVVVLVLKLLTSLITQRDVAAKLTILLVLLADVWLMCILTAPLSILYGKPVILWTHTINQAQHKQAAWEQLGGIYEHQDQLAPAWQCYHNALKLEPGFNIARLNMGIVMMRLGRDAQAIKLFELETHNPYHGAEAWQYLGIIYKSHQNYNKAIACFNKAHKLKPDRMDMALNLARVYNLKKQYQQAYDIMQPWAQSPRTNLELYHELGFSCSKLGRLKEAEQLYGRYLNNYPDDAMVLNSMGVVQARLGNTSQAASYFGRSLAADPSFEYARDNLARAKAALTAPARPQ